MPRVETLEKLRGQAQHCGSCSSCGSSSRTVGRQVTPADIATFQQQLRQEMADVTQQLRAEGNELISGRMDIMNSFNTALQNVSAKSTDSEPYRVSGFIPRNWEGSNEKGKFRSFMSDLHSWMQAWSNQGEKCLSALRAPTSSTAARLCLPVQTKNSDQSRHHCTKYCTEGQQKNR